MSFATTYRPSVLEDVVGNKMIKKIIQEIGTFSHTLFEGETGSGKTTLAYIIANKFGADYRNINDVNCINTSINDLREIIDNLSSSSIFGTKKVLILDEIHGISAQAKSLLLKPMEAFTKDVLIIACTNEPQKLPKPLLDRFTYRFEVLPLNNTDAKELLYKIATQENIQIPKWKLQLLLDKSQGIPRRLLNGLERIRNVEDEQEVKFLLEFSDEIKDDVLTFFKLLLSYNMTKFNSFSFWKKVSGSLKELMKTSSLEEIRVGIASLLMGRMTSEYIKVNDTTLLSELFQIVRTPLTFPEKADLIHRVYKCVEILTK